MSRKREKRKPKPKGPTKRRGMPTPLQMKTVNRIMPGLKMTWFDTDPLAHKNLNRNSVTVTHPSPSVDAFDFWASHAHYIQSKSYWEWGVRLVSVFEWEKTTQQEEHYESYYCVLEDIAEKVNEKIVEMMRFGDEEHYAGTHFTLECIGKAKTHLISQQEVKQLFDGDDIAAEIAQYINLEKTA